MPVDKLLLPGLSRDAVQRAVGVIHDPHPDILAWYAWHNGSGSRPECYLAPAGRVLTLLDEAIELRQVYLDVQAEMAEIGVEHTPADRYGHTWLPVATTRDAEGHAIAVDVVTGAVFRFDNGTGSDVYRQKALAVADDLATLVRIWCDELDRGSYVWDSTSYEWRYDAAAQPTDLRERHIIH